MSRKWKLRYFTHEGELVPTPEEAALNLQQQAVEAKQQAVEAQQQLSDTELRLQNEQERSQRLAEYLRSQGIDPDNLS
ncbi:hypothetical protein [Nostoc sp. PCC 7107]|uniref:hypothetical protein n=1 Tax=Nostoc sp. PCC 7107 TaxID=317936 RepID=UPI0002DC6ABE|nr:hypothetical protein [Nostoc sp. PCC 7107]